MILLYMSLDLREGGEGGGGRSEQSFRAQRREERVGGQVGGEDEREDRGEGAAGGETVQRGAVA